MQFDISQLYGHIRGIDLPRLLNECGVIKYRGDTTMTPEEIAHSIIRSHTIAVKDGCASMIADAIADAELRGRLAGLEEAAKIVDDLNDCIGGREQWKTLTAYAIRKRISELT